MGDVAEDLPGVLDGAYHDGDIRLLGNLEHAAAEMVELAVLAGVALGEDGDGRFVVLQQLDALDNGFQGSAVIFTVDGLAENFVHDLAHDEQLLILLLGDKGQLALWEAVQQHTGVGDEQVVAHQHEPPLGGNLLQARRMDAHPKQADQCVNVHLRDPAVKRAVVLLRLVHVHEGADQTQKTKGCQRKNQKRPDEQRREPPECHPAANTDQNRRNRGHGGNSLQQHGFPPHLNLNPIILRFSV